MKKTVSLCLVLTLMFCLVVPVFPEDKAPLTADQIKELISEQNRHMDAGADNLLAGVIVGAVTAATLIPVSMLFEEKNGNGSKVIYIIGGSMCLVTGILILWGGAEWLAANGKAEELKKMQKDMTITPYLNPLAQGGAVTGMGVDLKI